MSQLINPVGPEANNARAAEFEDQVVAWMGELGWDVRCRNIDLFARDGAESKGVDVLAAFDDPQLGQRCGLIGEAKIRHPLRADKTQKEVAALAKKLADLSKTIAKLDIAQDITTTRSGLVLYDAQPYDAEAALLGQAVSTMQLVGTTRSEWPREVWAVGPDTLVGMADAFARCAPAEFYWPPFGRSGGEWCSSAPPFQVAVGMVAWRDADGRVCLWLRDPLAHDEDFSYLWSLMWEWQINVDRVVCSSVSRDRWRTQRARWELDAKKARSRGVGLLPDEIDPRDLTWNSMTPWVDRWGGKAAA